MSRRSSRLANRKILKTEATEGTDDVGSTSSYEPSKAITSTSDGGGENSSASAVPASPLQNSVILRHVFNMCSTRMLLNCRLVCKQWYQESLISFGNASPLKFTVDDGDIVREYRMETNDIDDFERRTVPIQNFLDTDDPQRLHQGKPYPSILIRNSKIDSVITKKTQFEVFWNAFGRNLTTLELNNCTILDHEEFRRIIFFRCPKLKRLIIDNCEFTWSSSFEQLDMLESNEQSLEPNKHLKVLKILGYDDARKLPVSWLELFSHFPLLSSLSNVDNEGFDDYGNYDFKLPVDEFDDLTKAIRIIREKDGKLLPLNFFDIGIIEIPADSLTKQRLQILKELRLPFQRLSVELKPGVDDQFFRNTFAFHAGTLTDIKLKECIPTPSFVQFPFGHQLNNLLILSIDKTLCKNMAFLNYMPNLKDLTICGEDSAYQSTISNNEPSGTHLRMLKLNRLELKCRLNDDEIANLGDWMPNVKSFASHDLNDKQFGFVCKTWKNLKELVALGNRLTDHGVIGRKMKNKKKKGPNITNLPYLETVGIRSDKVTERSVFEGFLKLPNLRSLSNYGRVLWGKRAARAIVKRKIEFEQPMTPLNMPLRRGDYETDESESDF